MRTVDKIAQRFGFIRKSPDIWGAESTVSSSIDSISDKTIAEQFGQIFNDVDIIASHCAMVEPIFVKKSDPNELVQDHWIKTLFNSPNTSLSAYKFRNSIFGHKLVSPNVFIELEHSDKKMPIGLKVPLPSSISIETYTGEVVYRRHTDNSTIDPGKMINIFGFNPSSTIDGYSPLQSIKEFLSLEDLMLYYQKAYYKNGSFPGGFVFVKGSEDDVRAVREVLNKSFKGANNTNRLAVMAQPKTDPSDPVKFFVPELQKQVTTPELYDNIQKLKAKAFRVPDEIRGIVSNSTYASARVAQDIFMRNTIKSHLIAVYDEINHYFNTHFSKEDIEIKVDISPYLPNNYEDTEKQVSSATQLIAAGFDPADTLEKLGLPDIKYNGRPVASIDNTQKDITKAITIAKDVETDGELLLDEAPTEKYIRQMSSKIIRFMSDQRKRVLELLKKQKAISDIDELNIDDETDIILTAIMPIVFRMTTNAGTLSVQQYRLELRGFIDTDSIARYQLSSSAKDSLTEYFTTVFNGFNTETKDKLTAILQDAVDNNLTTSQVSRNIRDYYDGDTYRADRVARTEVIRNYNTTNRDIADQIAQDNELAYTKTWKTTSGDPCEFCLALEGTVVESGESFVETGKSIDGADGGSFTNNWEDVEDGNLHPHCQCTVVKTWSKL